MKQEKEMPNAPEMPTIPEYRRHALLCVGASCGENMALLRYLKERVEAAGLGADADNAVRVNRAGCLGVCRNGPVMVVHPEGVWYYALTPEKIDRIVEEHFLQGRPLAEYAFHGC